MAATPSASSDGLPVRRRGRTRQEGFVRAAVVCERLEAHVLLPCAGVWTRSLGCRLTGLSRRTPWAPYATVDMGRQGMADLVLNPSIRLLPAAWPPAGRALIPPHCMPVWPRPEGRKRVLEGNGCGERVRVGGREPHRRAFLRLARSPEQVHHERARSCPLAASKLAGPRGRGRFQPGPNCSSRRGRSGRVP
jgi:hypothetical protein